MSARAWEMRREKPCQGEGTPEACYHCLRRASRDTTAGRARLAERARLRRALIAGIVGTIPQSQRPRHLHEGLRDYARRALP